MTRVLMSMRSVRARQSAPPSNATEQATDPRFSMAFPPTVPTSLQALCRPEDHRSCNQAAIFRADPPAAGLATSAAALSALLFPRRLLQQTASAVLVSRVPLRAARGTRTSRYPLAAAQ